MGGIVEQSTDGARAQADSATANSQMTYVSPQLLEDSGEEDMVGLEGFENTLVRLSRTLKLIPDMSASTVSACIDFIQQTTSPLTLLSGSKAGNGGGVE